MFVHPANCNCSTFLLVQFESPEYRISQIKLFPRRVQESGVADYMGMFAVACMGCDEMVKKFEELNDDYSKIMVQVHLQFSYYDTSMRSSEMKGNDHKRSEQPTRTDGLVCLRSTPAEWVVFLFLVVQIFSTASTAVVVPRMYAGHEDKLYSLSIVSHCCRVFFSPPHTWRIIIPADQSIVGVRPDTRA